MILNDELLCQNCNETIEWYYQVPQLITSRFLEIEKIPMNKSKVFSCIFIKENTYELTCRCKNCYCDNVFQYETDLKLNLD